MRARGLIVTWVVACTACNAVLGVDDYGVPAGDKVPNYPVTYVEEQCETCVADSCATEERACRADKPCADLDACLAAVPRHGLQGRAACYEEHDLAIKEAPARALDNCRRANCLEKCLGTGGVLTSLGEECRRAVDQDPKCTSVVTDCFGSYVCERKIADYVACGEGSNNPACRYKALFDLERPEDDAERRRVQNLATEVRRCLPTHSGECGITEDFSCAGAYLWGNASVNVDSVPFTVKVLLGIDKDNSSPLEGATVDACEPQNTVGCVRRAGATSGAGGLAELSLPLTAGRFDGHFYVHDAGVFPTHLYPGRTLWRPVPAAAHSEDDVSVGVATLDTLREVLNPIQVDPTLGLLAVTNYSCWRVLAGGLVLSLDAGAETSSTITAYYPAGPTTATGSGLWFAINIAPGVREVTSTYGQEIVVDRRPIPIAAGALTVLVLYPDSKENRPRQ